VRFSLFWVILFLAAVSPVYAQVASAPQSPVFVRDRFSNESMVGKKAPRVVLHSTRGDKLDFESLRGQPVLITYWATWCGNCSGDLDAVVNQSLPPGVISIAVDFDRNPADAVAYLSGKNNPIRNFHDDGSLAAAYHLHQGPHTVSILVDSKGKIIFSARSNFLYELRQALASLDSPGGNQSPLPTQSKVSAAEIQSIAREAISGQTGYVESQKKYSCRYQIITRYYGDGGMSYHEVQHLDEVFTGDGHSIESSVVLAAGQEQPDHHADAASNTFSVWTDPVLRAVLDHSILSNIVPYKVTVRETGQQREYAHLTFRGDPGYTPATDVERIAQSLEGRITLDLTDRIFVIITGEAAYDVIDGSRFLLEDGIPVLEFAAASFEGVHLPSVWSVPAYRSVPVGPNQLTEWNRILVRSFGERQSCQIYHVTTKILPGFEPVSPSQ
jgi:thiol-disulfide isomerase/thioredoxin